MKERKLTDYEKSKAEKEFCFYHCKGFRDTKRCFCDSKCKDAQEFIQFLDYIVVKTKEDETEKLNQNESVTKTENRLSYNRKKWISKISLSKVIYEQ